MPAPRTPAPYFRLLSLPLVLLLSHSQPVPTSASLSLEVNLLKSSSSGLVLSGVKHKSDYAVLADSTLRLRPLLPSLLPVSSPSNAPPTSSGERSRTFLSSFLLFLADISLFISSFILLSLFLFLSSSLLLFLFLFLFLSHSLTPMSTHGIEAKAGGTAVVVERGRRNRTIWATALRIL